MKKPSFFSLYLNNFILSIKRTDTQLLENIVDELIKLKERKGRLFLLGVGGSAANCSHAVNDFRKICRIEAYAATDNISEITARTNDEGWSNTFVSYLSGSHLTKKDVVLIFSVSGGSFEENKSVNIALAANYAKKIGTQIIGILGGSGGVTAEVADIVVLIDPPLKTHTTPFSESMQAVIWHAIVNHPRLCIP